MGVDSWGRDWGWDGVVRLRGGEVDDMLIRCEVEKWLRYAIWYPRSCRVREVEVGRESAASRHGVEVEVDDSVARLDQIGVHDRVQSYRECCRSRVRDTAWD
jgi:hypothetical protein